jgi:hypothetical protein
MTLNMYHFGSALPDMAVREHQIASVRRPPANSPRRHDLLLILLALFGPLLIGLIGAVAAFACPPLGSTCSAGFRVLAALTVVANPVAGDALAWRQDRGQP